MKRSTPPRISFRFISWFCKESMQESILGDLEEQFLIDLKAHGVRKARILYTWRVIQFFRPGIIKKIVSAPTIYYPAIKNHFKIACRHLLKYKSLTVTNTIGLATGFCAFLIVALYVQHELSYDTFNENFERIYRVQHYAINKDRTRESITTPFPVSEELASSFPEVDKSTTLKRIGQQKLIVNDNVSYFEAGGFYAQPSFFDLFTVSFVQGNSNDLFTVPNQIVLTSSLARKLFNDQEPLGKVILSDSGDQLTVSGIIADMPDNSHLAINYLVSMKNLDNGNSRLASDWSNFSFLSYVLLGNSVNAASINDNLYNLPDDHIEDNNRKLYLKPMAELHLKPNGDGELTSILISYAVVAFFILVLACTNFINMSTARSAVRRKEIGIRKVIGGNRVELVFQFLSETVVICLLSMIAAFILAELLLPVFNEFTRRNLDIRYLDNWKFFTGICFAFISIGILAGLYPSLYLSKFKPLSVLRPGGRTSGNFRKSLVGFQSLISITLIICTFYVHRQITHMKNKDLGFDAEHVYHAEISGADSTSTFWALEESLLSNPHVLSVSKSSGIPFFRNPSREINQEGMHPDEKIHVYHNEVSGNFIDTYQIELIAGRNFKKSGDANSCLINEKLKKVLAWEDPIGKRIHDNQYTIIGVVKDFHTLEVHKEIRPYMMTLGDDKINGFNFYSLRLNSDVPKESFQHIKQTLAGHFPEQFIELASFKDNLGEDVNTSMQIWNGIQKTFIFFSSLSVVLALIGMLSLVAFIVQRRTKEVGIRKIVGATDKNILIIVAGEFLKPLCLAFSIAAPLAYTLSEMVPGYNMYKMQITDILFVGAMIFGIAFLTALHHLRKLSGTNPIEALRDE